MLFGTMKSVWTKPSLRPYVAPHVVFDSGSVKLYARYPANNLIEIGFRPDDLTCWLLWFLGNRKTKGKIVA